MQELAFGVARERLELERAETVREPLVGLGAGGARQRSPQRKPRPELGIVERHAEPVAQQVAERPVRRRLAIRDATTLEPDVLLGEPVELRQETALADPRFARE